MSNDVNRPDGDQPNPGRREFLAGALAFGTAAAGLSRPAYAAGAEPAKAVATVNTRLFSFVGGKGGEWSVVSAKAIVGDPLPAVERVDIIAGAVAAMPAGGKWILRGVTTNERYVTRDEKDALVKKQVPPGPPDIQARGADPAPQERQVVGDDAGRAAGAV